MWKSATLVNVFEFNKIAYYLSKCGKIMKMLISELSLIVDAIV